MRINKVKVRRKNKYPSAELIKDICYNEYVRVLNTYDKIYEKTNIALAFSGVVLLVILGSFDYTVLFKIIKTTSKSELLVLLVYFLSSLASCVLIVCATINLLLLMRSKSITVISAVDMCNEKLYTQPTDFASLWITEKYVKSLENIKSVTLIKQNRFNASIIKIVIALICYAIALVIEKGI